MKDVEIMQRALELAKKGESSVSPNPMVGAVLVSKGKIITEGWHKKYGGPHAEAELFSKMKKIPNDATLYVTLEPCVHTNKKTPPCVPLILNSGIKKVVVAMKDPNPLVNGKGVTALKKAGIKVDVGCLQKEAEELNEKFVTWQKTGMPFVGLKVGMSLDGKIATKTGESKWITSEASRKYVYQLRDTYDAIVVGKNTVLRDDPKLAGATRELLRIVLDSKLEVSLNSKIFRNKNVLVVTTKKASAAKLEALHEKGIETIIFPSKISLTSLLRTLGERKVSSLFVEGGSEVFGSFLDECLVDRVYWFIAPKIIGGRSAKTAIGGEGISKIKDILTLTDMHVTHIDQDLLITARTREKSK